MWSKRVHKEFGSFATLMLGGVFLGNILLALLSLVPLLFVVISFMHGAPGEVKVIRAAREIDVSWGEETVLRSRLKVDEGVGMVVVEEEVPPLFGLVSGSNFRTFWKGPRPLDVEMSFSVRCTRRGAHLAGRFKDERVHFSGLKGVLRGGDDGTVAITVRPRTAELRRARDHRLFSRIPMPPGAISKLGSRTTDFREIRQYASGDLYKNINWKATVRSGRDERDPLVNEFEREGKKTAWIFLDGRPHMMTGSNIDNAFEHGVQAASALSSFYLARGCNVGLNVLGCGKMVLPDIGRRQGSMIDQALLEVELSSNREPLEQALRRCRGHMAGRSPLVVLITMVDKDNIGELKAGIWKMLALFGQGTKVMVVHISGHHVAAESTAEDMAAKILDMRMLPEIRSLRGGSTVCSWNPRQQSITSLMLRGAAA